MEQIVVAITTAKAAKWQATSRYEIYSDVQLLLMWRDGEFNAIEC